MSALPRQYDVVRAMADSRIGGGNAGILIVRHRTTGRLVVEKTFSTEHVRARLASREIAILGRLSRKHIVKFVDFYVGPDNTFASVFLEHCNAGSLGKLITSHSRQRYSIGEQFVWKVFSQVSSALVYCHSGPENSTERWIAIIHKDIKPDNIFFKWGRDSRSPEVKLGDFGCSERMGWPSMAGTPGFYPPEFPESVGQGDVWQLGASIQCMCCLQHAAHSSYSLGPQYSEQLKGLIRLCMSHITHHRPHSRPLLQMVDNEVALLQEWLLLQPNIPLLFPQTRRQWAPP